MAQLPTQDVTLEVDGRRYGQWTQVQVTRSIESACASFQLQSFGAAGAAARSAIVVRPQAPCTVKLSGVPVITGYVDDVDVSATPDATGVNVTGRSLTCDLVDCHAPDAPRVWSNATVRTIAESCAAPYGVGVVLDAPLGAPFSRFRAQPTETQWSIIERAATLRSLLVTDDEFGNLVLTRAGTARLPETLAAGVNLAAYTVQYKGAERYSSYVCRGQRALESATAAATAAHVEGRADDAGSRTRVLVVQAQGRPDPAAALERARWEMLTRYGRSLSVQVTVPGWARSDGTLWPVNRLVRVQIPRALLDLDLLITSATYQRSVGGTTTTLTLQPPEAFATYTAPTRTRGRVQNGFWKELDQAGIASAQQRARALGGQ